MYLASTYLVHLLFPSSRYYQAGQQRDSWMDFVELCSLGGGLARDGSTWEYSWQSPRLLSPLITSDCLPPDLIGTEDTIGGLLGDLSVGNKAKSQSHC